MKVLATSLLALALLVPLPASAIDMIGVWPGGTISLNHSNHKSEEIRLVPAGEAAKHGPQWDLMKGTCYTHQIAGLNIHGWKRDKGIAYFPAIITATGRGLCDLWIKAGPVETKVQVFVQP